jgi:hypothetical protein
MCGTANYRACPSILQSKSSTLDNQQVVIFGQLVCAVLRSTPSGRYHVHEPTAYAHVKRVAFFVIRTPVLPVRSTGHLGSTQPGAGVAVGEVVEGSTVEEAVEDSVVEGTVEETVELLVVEEAVDDSVVEEAVEDLVVETVAWPEHSSGTADESLWLAASTPRPRKAKAFQSKHLFAPPYRVASAWIQASRAETTSNSISTHISTTPETRILTGGVARLQKEGIKEVV